MHPLQAEYAAMLTETVKHVCQENLLEKLEQVDPIRLWIGISLEEAKEITQKLVVALPETFFLNRLHLNKHILYLIATEFVLFQAQEMINIRSYGENLANFIYEIAGFIMKKYPC